MRNRRDWLLSNSNQEPGVLVKRLTEALECPPIIARILAQRGILDPETASGFLDPHQYRPAPPEALPDLTTAVQSLSTAIDERDHILVWGDFDVDGQTATALLVDGLRRLDAVVTYHIPDRLSDSHGIQINHLERLIAERAPRILLTCDTGILEHPAVEFANANGLTVLISDHHDLPRDGVLPAATAVVNPKRLKPDHPLRSLPGVGVAFKLMQALYTHYELPDVEVERLLDLVALGIVADVAEQTRDTRYLLQRGMEQLQHTDRVGLQALFEVAGLNPQHLTTESIGFQLGPRLNAAGRLADATRAVELLLTRDRRTAALIAAELDALNRKRRVLQREILAAAESMLMAKSNLLDHAALVLYQPGWHPGLIGIVAGQLAERFGRPCVLLTSDPEGELARGSARSAPGHDIGAAISAQADLLVAYGGHPGAAGLSLPVANIDRFRRRLSKSLEESYSGDGPQPLLIDAEVALEAITPEFAEDLFRLAPFGEGNPPITLMTRDLTLANHATIGRENLHRRLTVTDGNGTIRQVLWWDGMEHPVPDGAFDLAFHLGWNTYQGRREMALTFVDFRDITPPDTALAQRPAREIVDWRAESLEQALEMFVNREPEGQVWAEGTHSDSIREATHHFLKATEALLIYTAPPSRATLNLALERTGAHRIYFAAGIPDDHASVSAFQRRLLGICRTTIIRWQGRGNLERMAGALGHPIATILWGLRLLAASNAIDLKEFEDHVVIGRPAGLPAAFDQEEASRELQVRLQEAQSFRNHFRRAPLESILD